MRTSLFILLLAGTLGADVLVLKDGRRIGGKIVEKGGAFEVTTEAGLKTFLKDEVEKTIATPAELLGDSEKALAEAKQEYLQALEIKDAAAQSAKLKETIQKLVRARDAFAGTRELFWEDKYADLDLKLVQVMQLMRLLRERVGSEFARRPDAPKSAPLAPPPPPPPPAAGLTLDQAFAVAADPAQRADAGKRAAARDLLRAARSMTGATGDLAASAALFLSKADKDWKLEGPTLAALQAYFAKPWLREIATLTPAAHLEAGRFLGEQQKAGVAPEALRLFAMGHLGHAAGADLDKVASSVGLSVKEKAVGTTEGHAAADLLAWLAAGDWELAALAYAREARGTAADTPAVRFLWSYALVRQAQAKKRGFDRPVKALDAVAAPDAAVRDHAAALAKSVKNVSVCSYCTGEGKVRCTNCHGRKEVRTDCAKCKGVGAVTGAGGGLASCAPCKGRGYDRLLKCQKCKDGYPECHLCDKKPRTPPEVEDLFMAAVCGTCNGRGLYFQKVLWPCPGCLGLGQKLTPRADPSKVLP